MEECHVARPEKKAAVRRVLEDGGRRSYVARGAGRSYGDASLNEGEGVIDDSRLDRFLSLDPDEGRVRVEAGVPLTDLVDVCLENGFFIPVTPGTQDVTVGGAVAADVHGKNHHVDGALAEHVQRITIATPGSGIVTCSPSERSELFWATMGGMGLTGVILTATLDLLEVPSAYVRETRTRTSHLDETLAELAEADEKRYAVAWLDTLAKGNDLGRGVVLSGEHAPASEAPGAPWTVPSRTDVTAPRLPSGTLSRFTGKIFNAAYYWTHGPREDIVPYSSFFYPLDRIRRWDRAYGSCGLLQTQVVIPAREDHEGVRSLVQHVAQSGVGSFLAVLKRFGPEDPGLLSFPMEGYTLAFDMPATDAALELSRTLNRLTADMGGRVYLAKDATLTEDLFERMYPRAEAFREIKARVDPEDRVSSSLARRVGLVRS